MRKTRSCAKDKYNLIASSFRLFAKTYSTVCGKTVLIQRRAGLKKLVLRFSKRQKAFVVSAPPYLPFKDIAGFIDGAKSWLANAEKQIQLDNQPKTITPGKHIRIMGQKVRLAFTKNCQEKVVLKDGILEISGAPSKFTKILFGYLQEIALEKFSHYSALYAKNLGVDYAKIVIKDMKTRFGSCTSSGHLNYCWRVIMAPEPVIAYLCAHEVSHLREMNHSKAFWKCVENLCPDFQIHRKWFRQHGRELFLYGI